MTDNAPSSKADQYNAVVERARLVDVMLTSSVFKVAHGFRGKEVDAEKYIDEQCGDANYLQEEKMLLGQVQLRVWMTEKGVEAPKDSGEVFFKSAPVQIEAKYVVAFEIPGEHAEEIVTTFFERTAVFTAWPYFRALVAQYGSASEIEIPILPIKQLSVPLRKGAEYGSLSGDAGQQP